MPAPNLKKLTDGVVDYLQNDKETNVKKLLSNVWTPTYTPDTPSFSAFLPPFTAIATNYNLGNKTVHHYAGCHNADKYGVLIAYTDGDGNKGNKKLQNNRCKIVERNESVEELGKWMFGCNFAYKGGAVDILVILPEPKDDSFQCAAPWNSVITKQACKNGILNRLVNEKKEQIEDDLRSLRPKKKKVRRLTEAEMATLEGKLDEFKSSFKITNPRVELPKRKDKKKYYPANRKEFREKAKFFEAGEIHNKKATAAACGNEDALEVGKQWEANVRLQELQKASTA